MTDAIYHTLSQAVDNNDISSFRAAYYTFLSQFPSFTQAVSASAHDIEVRSAIFGEAVYHLHATNDSEAHNMLAKSRAASQRFSMLPLDDRLDFLTLLEAKIAERLDDIMLTITADTGKPIDLARAEMQKGKEWFHFAREHAAEQLATTIHGTITSSYRPLGAAQIIGAYNYPYALAISGIVGALAAGNGVIITAPLKAPSWIFPFYQAVCQALHTFALPLPEQLIQYSIGINQLLTSQADLVQFVGNDLTADHIRALREGKKTILEMSGTNMVIVMLSALRDYTAETIAEAIYNGFAPATGQRCTAPRILCAQHGSEAVVKALIARVANNLSNHHIGNPFHPGTKIGPLVDHHAYLKMQDMIATAKKFGATIYGQMDVNNNSIPQAHLSHALFVSPVIIDWSAIHDPSRIGHIYAMIKHEIFAPLLHIIHPIHQLDDAVAITNTLDKQRLAGSLFSCDNNEITTYRTSTSLTSLTINGAPKDHSPYAVHGHPGSNKIGGDKHFSLYADQVFSVDMSATLPKRLH